LTDFFSDKSVKPAVQDQWVLTLGAGLPDVQRCARLAWPFGAAFRFAKSMQSTP